MSEVADAANWTWFRRLEAASYLAAVFAIGATAYQLYKANGDRAVDATLGYLRVLSEDPLADMQREITDRWLEHREALAVMQQQKVSGPNIALFTREVIYGRASEEPQQDLTSFVVAIVRNLDQLAICVDAGLCDCNTAREHLGEYAIEIHQTYAPIVSDYRLVFGGNSLGIDLQEFVENSKCAR